MKDEIITTGNNYSYYSILDQMEDAILIVDQYLRIIYVNRHLMLWLEKHGYKNVIEGLTIKEAFPFFTEKNFEEYRHVLETGNILTTEETISIDQNNYFTKTQKIPILEVGCVTKVLTVIRDITTVMESERRFITLINNLPGIAYRCKNDRYWTMEYIYGGCEKLLGYKPEDIVNNSALSYNDLIYPDDQQAVWDSIQNALNEKLSYQIVYRIQTAEGEIKWVWEKGTGVFTRSGEVTALEGFITDITELKRAEETLKEKEEFLSSIVENIPDMIFIKDAGELRFIRFNKAGENLLGYSREELIGRNDYDFFPREQADFFTKKDMEVLGKGQVFDIPEEPLDTKTGRRILRTKKIPILDKNGKPVYLLGISEDITDRIHEEKEREKLQAQLAQSQKMESIGRLAGGVAHDFNNMLGVILGYTELVMSDIGSFHPAFNKLREIRKAAQHSADLTSHLLAFARKQTVAPRLLDLNKTVEGILKILRRLIGEDIDFSWMDGAGVGPVKVDPSQIDQILTNLCVNARDAIAGVGRIVIETRPVIFDKIYCGNHPEFLPGEYALLMVSDNGCGMEKYVLDKLFEPFFTTKEQDKGAGLGLAIVYGIVKQNKGVINVYSEPGHGTTFKIYLPCTGKDIEEETGIIHDIQLPRGHETILLVEDEHQILEISKLMLESLGYQVLTAITPGEAVKLAREQPDKIQLLITDVIMPEMNGKDLADKLAYFCPDLKSLFTSGYTSNIIASQGILEDGVNFIQKPFTIQDLAFRVRVILDRK